MTATVLHPEESKDVPVDDPERDQKADICPHMLLISVSLLNGRISTTKRVYLEEHSVTKQSIATEQASCTWACLDITVSCVIVESPSTELHDLTQKVMRQARPEPQQMISLNKLMQQRICPDMLHWLLLLLRLTLTATAAAAAAAAAATVGVSVLHSLLPEQRTHRWRHYRTATL